MQVVLSVICRQTILLLLLFSISLSASLAQVPNREKKYWVFFKDKGPPAKTGEAWQRAAEMVSPRAQERRTKRLRTPFVLGEEDLPLHQPYLHEIIGIGGRLRHQIRWLNAASFLLTPDQVQRTKNLFFVEKVYPVGTFYRRDVPVEAPHLFKPEAAVTLDYGSSLAQNVMIGAANVHALGIAGEGVIVGMLDTGFRWRVHESLQNARVIAEYDFIQNDDITANQAGDRSDQDRHGTLTMSVLGGYMPGRLIGPAYGVQFLLGKTEYVPTETRIEEDDWAAGIEWMESLGADVVSSSLGYFDFDPPGPSPGDYRWENGDFDGRTAVTSLAAVRAARLGVVICTAMGNEGNGDGVQGTLIAPADADSILSVGAVTFSRQLTSFSSTGPTNDGRFKPEVVAPGSGVYGAVPGQSSYSFASGTSLSTPLAAASAALVLSARPELTVMQVRTAILATSDTIATGDPQTVTRPNNFIGYGLVNVFQALLSFGPVFSNSPSLSLVDSQNVVTAIVVSKFGLRADSVQLKYTTAENTVQQTLAMTIDSNMFFPTSGRYLVAIPRLPLGTLVRFHIEASDSLGNLYTSPPPTAQNPWEFRYGSTMLGQPPLAFKLRQNYPNPFNAGTWIEFETPLSEEIDLVIYNILGQRVATVFHGISQAGMKPLVFWDGRNDNGIPLPSGVYLYRLRTASFSETKKMLLLR